MTTTVARWTIPEYHALVEAGLLLNRRVELLNGLIVEMAPEGPDHADLSTDAIEWFISRANGRYRVRPSQPMTIASSNSEPEPDLALVQPKSYRQSHPIPSDVYLVIEFSNSSLAKDTDEKRRAYASAGIQDYWVVNLRTNGELIVYRDPIDGDYRSQQHLTQGFVSPLFFPDVTTDVRLLLG
jgi:Uma2 family endonuclease